MADNRKKTIGICGGGKMGIALFKYLYQYEDDLIFCIRNPEVRAKLERSSSRGEGAKTKKCIFTGEIADLGKCDMVFELIYEDVDLKSSFFNRLAAVRENDLQIAATVSSSFVPSKIAANYPIERIVGAHFIYPIQYMETLELVYGVKTSSTVIDDMIAYLKNINKRPVLVDEETGCITTKVLCEINNEVFMLHKNEGIPLIEFDRLIAKEQYMMPTFILTDAAGFDIALNTIYGHFLGKDELKDFEEIINFFKQGIQDGNKGKKSGKGFYDYSQEINIDDLSAASTIPDSLYQTICNDLKALYVNVCFRFLDRGWVDTGELDMIFCEINQTNIGPSQILFENGPESMVTTIDNYNSKYHRNVKLSKTLKYLADNKMQREEIDTQIRKFKLDGNRPGWY